LFSDALRGLRTVERFINKLSAVSSAASSTVVLRADR
jgi:hypothetical protein